MKTGLQVSWSPILASTKETRAFPQHLQVEHSGKALIGLPQATHPTLDQSRQGTGEGNLGGVASPAIREAGSRSMCRGENVPGMTADAHSVQLTEALASTKIALDKKRGLRDLDACRYHDSLTIDMGPGSDNSPFLTLGRVFAIQTVRMFWTPRSYVCSCKRHF